MKIYYFFYYALLFLTILSLPVTGYPDYLILPKLESGNHTSELYQSTFFIPNYNQFTFTPYFFSNFNSELSFGALFALSLNKYGLISLSYAEKNVDHLIYIKGNAYLFHNKESSYNLSYQLKLGISNLIISGNLSDPIHIKAFQFNGQILPSMNVGIQIEPRKYVMLEGGLINLFKSSSFLVQDNSEEFYIGASIMLFQSLSTRFTVHSFKGKKINANAILRYYFTDNIFISSHLSNNPTILSIGAGYTSKIGYIKAYGGLKDNHGFIFLTYTLLYSYDKKHPRGLIAKSSPDHPQNDSNLVNINTANEKDLMALPNIGLKKAKKIIEYRLKYGLFYTNEDLRNVPGIGAKIYRKLKDLITVGKVNPKKRLMNILNWTMKDFIDIGFKPVLALRLVLFIRYDERFKLLDDLLLLEDMDLNKLLLLKSKLKEYESL